MRMLELIIKRMTCSNENMELSGHREIGRPGTNIERCKKTTETVQRSSTGPGKTVENEHSMRRPQLGAKPQ